MTQLLWTFEDDVRFSQHPERVVRRWAFERLTKQHPDRAAEPLVGRLDDADEYVATQSARFLGHTGDLQYGPVLLRHLEQARGNRASHLAMALGDLGYHGALPLLLNRSTGPKRGREKLDLNELLVPSMCTGEGCSREPVGPSTRQRADRAGPSGPCAAER